MLSVFRLDFEVVKEGRIFNKIKHLQNQIVGVFYLVPGWSQVLDENGVFWAEIMSWKYSSAYENNI
jgi:hypothetical protein